MNENDTNSSDGTYTTGAVSTAAATVHSDDFQMPRPSSLRYCDDNRGEGSPFRQTARKDLPDEESDKQFVMTDLESDSRVPSVSSQASVPSTSSCNSSKGGSTDQERPLQIMNSSDVWKEDEGPLKGQKTREALWKRHQREAKRIAWERRSTSNRGSTSSCPSPPQAIHQGGGRYGRRRERVNDGAPDDMDAEL
ncbi:hypothetical protein CRV24_008344 [Beauveria bassiana]|nr:hypothetical protein CRV24_008344 [Beauveria bassiana]